MVPCALLKASRTILQFCVWVSASKNVSSFMNGSIANTVPKSAIVPHSSSTCATTLCSCGCSSRYAFSGATPLLWLMVVTGVGAIVTILMVIRREKRLAGAL